MEFLEQKLLLCQWHEAKIKKINNILFSLFKEKERCLKWESTQHQGLLLQANLFRMHKGCSSIEVDDWKSGTKVSITIDNTREPYDQIKEIFEFSKRQKRGLEKVEEKIVSIQASLLSYERNLKTIERAENLEELLPFLSKNKNDKQKISKHEIGLKPLFHHYLTASGLHIWAGKNASANDKLTFNFAHGNDYWLHVNTVSGSHVILRPSEKNDVDDESLKDAMQIALFHSKAFSSGSAEIVVTQRKCVVKFAKAKPGAVNVSKHKNIYVKVDRQRLNRLLS